jgi:hypothetical protein
MSVGDGENETETERMDAASNAPPTSASMSTKYLASTSCSPLAGSPSAWRKSNCKSLNATGDRLEALDHCRPC